MRSGNGNLPSLVVLVPLEERWEDEGLLSLVFSHEYAHIRRLDALRKLALAFCAAFHWFNPLVWLMLAVMPGDLELACDEAVIARLGHGYRRAYCLALLNMEERRQISLFGCSFAKNNLEKRIRSVMNMKPKSSLSLVLSLALILCLFGMTAGADTSLVRTVPTETEGLFLVEETVLPDEVPVAFPAQPAAMEETLSAPAEETRTLYPVVVEETFTYDYYNLVGDVIATATVTVTGEWYGLGDGEITGVDITFSGEAASLFSASGVVNDGRGKASIYMDGLLAAVYNYRMQGSTIA